MLTRPQPAITQAHRDEIVGRMQDGALSFRALCSLIEREKWPRRKVDRGLVLRTLHSCVDRGDLFMVLVRRPGLTPSHRERRAYYVYVPAPPLITGPTKRAKLRRSQRPVLRAWRGLFA